jgi:hypothetical protein
MRMHFPPHFVDSCYVLRVMIAALTATCTEIAGYTAISYTAFSLEGDWTEMGGDYAGLQGELPQRLLIEALGRHFRPQA